MSFIICGPSRYQIGVLAYYDRVIIIETPLQKGGGQYHDGKKKRCMLIVCKSEILDVKCVSFLVFMWTTGCDSEKNGTSGHPMLRVKYGRVETFLGWLRICAQL